MTTQTDLIELLDVISTSPEAWRIDERTRIVAAIATCWECHGVIDPNIVRELLSNEHGLTVNPRVLSATWSSLRHRGVIERDGWTTNDDRNGNGGKPLRTYRWIGEAP